jgi:hypothetical protein
MSEDWREREADLRSEYITEKYFFKYNVMIVKSLVNL